MLVLRNGSKSMVWSILRRSSGTKGSRDGQRDTTSAYLGQFWKASRWRKARKALLQVLTFPPWKMKGRDKTESYGDQRTNDTITLNKNLRQLPLAGGVILLISRTSSLLNHRNGQRKRKTGKTDGRGQTMRIAWLMKTRQRRRRRRRERIQKLQALLQPTPGKLSPKTPMVACIASARSPPLQLRLRGLRRTMLSLTMNCKRHSCCPDFFDNPAVY